MKIKVTDTTTRDVEITLPYYAKGKIGYYMITENELCLKVTNGINGMEDIGWSCKDNVLNTDHTLSSKEEFEKAFETTLTIIKNRVYGTR